MRNNTGTANLHLSTHCLCRQRTTALKPSSLSAYHPVLRRHQNSALAVMTHDREQQLSHSPNWAHYLLISPTTALWLEVSHVSWSTCLQGLILKEHWGLGTWSIWRKREESENTGIFHLPTISSECIPFQCRKVHLIHFNLLSFAFCAEIFSELFSQIWLQNLKNIWWNLTRVNLALLKGSQWDFIGSVFSHI